MLKHPTDDCMTGLMICDRSTFFRTEWVAFLLDTWKMTEISSTCILLTEHFMKHRETIKCNDRSVPVQTGERDWISIIPWTIPRYLLGRAYLCRNLFELRELKIGNTCLWEVIEFVFTMFVFVFFTTLKLPKNYNWLLVWHYIWQTLYMTFKSHLLWIL